MKFKPVEIDAITLGVVRYRKPLSPRRLEETVSGEYGIDGGAVVGSIFRLVKCGMVSINNGMRVVPHLTWEV